jgi:hypothetical protein
MKGINMKKSSLKTPKSINLPIIIGFSDYHEIDYFKETLAPVCPKLKAEELNLEDWGYNTDNLNLSPGRFYYGLFYIGPKPVKRKLQELIAQALNRDNVT